jgi:hypothetical protein
VTLSSLKRTSFKHTTTNLTAVSVANTQRRYNDHYRPKDRGHVVSTSVRAYSTAGMTVAITSLVTLRI